MFDLPKDTPKPSPLLTQGCIKPGKAMTGSVLIFVDIFKKLI